VEDKNKFHIILSNENPIKNDDYVFKRINNELMIINNAISKYFDIDESLKSINNSLEGELIKFNSQLIDLNKLKESISAIKENLLVNVSEEFSSYNENYQRSLTYLSLILISYLTWLILIMLIKTSAT
jgi:hypothetical protein